jgi:predicted AAA+ superfamily ATPase
MDRLIGRKSERQILERVLTSGKAELVAVYGRRRVGKTWLVRMTYKAHLCFELTGLHNGNLSDQLLKFYYALGDRTKGFEKPTTWFEAFRQLEQYIKRTRSKKKKVLFFDEFPWLAGRKSKFMMAFENFWNSFASRRADLVVVICGSAASFMVKKVIRNRGGLHNRITVSIRLMPFSVRETANYLKSKGIKLGNYDIVQLYMAIGGVPHYLDKVLKGESVAQAVERLCFYEDGPLRTEFPDLFASLFENSDRHSDIVRALSRSRKGLTRSEITKLSGMPSGGRLTNYLEELSISGFIEKYASFGKEKKDSLYRLTDEYSSFFLKFIDGTGAKGRQAWTSKFNTAGYRSWSGFSFESLCIKHIEDIKAGLGIAGSYSECYSWVEKNEEGGAQIDLIIDRSDNVINICEIKFHKGEFSITKDYAKEIRNKVTTFKASSQTTKNIFVTMITNVGLRQNQYSLELIQNELNINCLFDD